MHNPVNIRTAPDQHAAVSVVPGHTQPADPPVAEAMSVVDLTKGFRSGLLRRRLRGIEGISFTVKRGEIFALLGHNGAGKTTTINCLLNLCRPDAGRVTLLGKDHADPSARRDVGYLPERPYFFEHLTGWELLRFYGDLLDRPRAGLDTEIATVLARVGMAEASNRRLRKLSKGMLQRLGIAQALLGDPKLLIMDEPMSGLDPMGRRDVRELLRALRAEGCTILLSSHIVPDIEMLADTVAIINQGRVARTCSRDEITARSSYIVHTESPAGGTDQWPGWLQEACPEQAGRALRIAAPDTAELRDILENCHGSSMSVRSVETQRTGLEDLFMAVQEHGGTT
ncbi:ABC transporter ATP-binding protein [bacterium]|nr:MAG: ABC transporter ATP-binding protein [bacterium]